MEEYESIDSVLSLERALQEVKEAQEQYAKFSQEQVDKIFACAAMAASRARIELARIAVEETKMGVFEDKVMKNHLASEFVYNKYKNEKTCGKIDENDSFGIQKIACPVGIIGALIPTTNPTSTAIFKILIALKTRNAIVISPHPRAKNCTIKACKIMLEAAIKAGAPKDIIKWIDHPTIELTKSLMSSVDLILATGGSAMVKAAYSSGKPAIGVGAGNTPVVIDKSANILTAVNSIIHSKIFDNGMICASEQAVVVVDSIYDVVKCEFEARGCRFLSDEEIDALRGTMFPENVINPEIVGQSAHDIAMLAGIDVDKKTKVLIAELKRTDAEEALSQEKLSPVLAMYKAKDFEDALDIAYELVENGGLGHTSSIYIDEEKASDRLDAFADRMKTCRILVNTPASHGGVGDIYNFNMPPSFTLGCGSWGGNSTCENVGISQLLNIKTVASRRENMLWLRVPERIYFKRGCFSSAIDEIKNEMNKNRVFVVTDNFLFKNGYAKPVANKLQDVGLEYEIFYNVEPDPTLASIKEGVKRMAMFAPDTIIAFGGGSALDAAKIMWVLYEHPNMEFEDMSLRFGDIRKRICQFPKMGNRAYFVAVPTSAGTGSEVTPFAVITNEKNGIKYPIADYELLPNMAIIDTDFQMTAPKELIRASGIDAITHALEAYVSVMATDYTDSLALSSLILAFEYLPKSYNDGENREAKEKMSNSATMAGIAFANAFLGVCHSMAHKLGSFHHLPHGVSNALLIEEVIRFNAYESPAKMGTFSQYAYPHSLSKYAKIANYLGVKGENDKEKLEGLICKLNELKKIIGVKETIKDYGVEEKAFLKSLDQMSREAFDDQCTGTNPRYPLVAEIKQMYLNAYYGKNKNKTKSLESKRWLF